MKALITISTLLFSMSSFANDTPYSIPAEVKPVFQQTITVDLSQSCKIGVSQSEYHGIDTLFVKNCNVNLDFLPQGVILDVEPTSRRVKNYGATSSFLNFHTDGKTISVEYKYGYYNDDEPALIKENLKNITITFQGPLVR